MGLILPVSAPVKQQLEGGHWYDRSGRPCYEQRTQKGGLRATDLRDGRKLGLVPSVTTVLSVIAKPQLENWKVEQGIWAALTATRSPGESDESFIARVITESKQQTKDAANEGSRIHDGIECSFKGLPFPSHYEPHVEAVRNKLHEIYPGVNDWVAEASFAHPSGYGGKVDLHSPSTGIVIDHKGKDGDFSDGKKLAYDQHWQLAPYNRGLLLPPSECANLFVSRTHPGKVAHHIWTQKEIDEGWSVFEGALELWKRLRKFDSAF
jgi:hypothetical protein